MLSDDPVSVSHSKALSQIERNSQPQWMGEKGGCWCVVDIGATSLPQLWEWHTGGHMGVFMKWAHSHMHGFPCLYVDGIEECMEEPCGSTE